jgi:hypothetical protein
MTLGGEALSQHRPAELENRERRANDKQGKDRDDDEEPARTHWRRRLLGTGWQGNSALIARAGLGPVPGAMSMPSQR